MNILATFPSIPQRVHYQLLELAWGSKKKRREKAQEILAALGSLYFVKVSPHFSESILLSEVPRIILSECVAHYESVASKTKGYDENWEVKTEML